MAAFDKIVVVTQKTALEELIERFNSRDQARFYIEHAGASFDNYQDAHDVYHAAVDQLRQALPDGLRSQFIERSFLPNFLFGMKDLIVALGRDGLVVNVAKYLDGQPLVGFNPDASRIDGILLPFSVEDAMAVLAETVAETLPIKRITMAKATLNDGQTLYAVNDLFVGQRSHCSARYRLSFCGRAEDQSSSGIIVSTGAGSTGWFRSILTGAAAVAKAFGDSESAMSLGGRYRFDWEAEHLYFNVREPFVSRSSAAELACGKIEAGQDLTVVSQMPQNGVIFSDGVEADFLQFNSGCSAQIARAEKKFHLVTPLPAKKAKPGRWTWSGPKAAKGRAAGKNRWAR